jgi:dTDP-glucose 4,6-dehydratase
MAKRVLLTGIGGFIGAHCLDHWLKETDWEIIGIDSFRHKGSVRRLEEVHQRDMRWACTYKEEWARRVKIYSHDLSVPLDHQLENLIMGRKVDENGCIVDQKLDYIVNMASDSAVERSASDPVACLRNNYDLTINMLEFARKVRPTIFYQVSTDEVYGEAKSGQSHKEWDVIMPSNPYAASKAAQEAVAISYWRTYGVPVVITNTMNNIGEWQDPEKFLPKIIQFVATGQEMPIYADSESTIGTRFYLHAKNHADAFVFLSKHSASKYDLGSDRPDRYNVCGDVELNNLELAQLVAKILGKPLRFKLVKPETARKGYDRRYALDGSKMKQMGWVPPLTFEQSIERIVKWTMDNPHWLI